MKNISFKPLFNIVVVEEPVIKTSTDSGIIKPESMTNEERQAINRLKVVAVGPDVKNCKPGDIVGVNRHAVGIVTPLEDKGGKYLALPDNQLIVVYDTEK